MANRIVNFLRAEANAVYKAKKIYPMAHPDRLHAKDSILKAHCSGRPLVSESRLEKMFRFNPRMQYTSSAAFKDMAGSCPEQDPTKLRKEIELCEKLDRLELSSDDKRRLRKTIPERLFGPLMRSLEKDKDILIECMLLIIRVLEERAEKDVDRTLVEMMERAVESNAEVAEALRKERERMEGGGGRA